MQETVEGTFKKKPKVLLNNVSGFAEPRQALEAAAVLNLDVCIQKT